MQKLLPRHVEIIESIDEEVVLIPRENYLLNDKLDFIKLELVLS